MGSLFINCGDGQTDAYYLHLFRLLISAPVQLLDQLLENWKRNYYPFKLQEISVEAEIEACTSYQVPTCPSIFKSNPLDNPLALLLKSAHQLLNLLITPIISLH